MVELIIKNGRPTLMAKGKSEKTVLIKLKEKTGETSGEPRFFTGRPPEKMA